MKILYMIDHLRPDGTQQMLSSLVMGLSERGHQQSILALNNSWDQKILKRLEISGTEVSFVGRRNLATGLGIFKMYRWLRKESFDVVITMLFFADVIGRPLSKFAGIPYVISSIRARNLNYALWQRWLARATMRFADVIVLNSESIRPFTIDQEGAPPAKTVVIRNGVEIHNQVIEFDREALCRQLGLPSDSTIIGTVGRLTYQKGFDVLLEAFGHVCNENLHLLIIGKGEEAQNLKAQVRKLKLNGNVHFAGYRYDVPVLLRLIDLYVQPSRFEGMPNALLEAMAAGCPIIASEVDGIRELIEDGVHGWLVPPEDPQALAKAIMMVLEDKNAAQNRAVAAKERATNDFSLDQMIAAWEKVLLGISIHSVPIV